MENGEATFAEVTESIDSFPMELGMEFESDEHALSYYSEYARLTGFTIRKEYVNRSKAGYVTSRKITCSREGYRGKDKRDSLVKNHRKETRTGCSAHVVISRNQSNGKYDVMSFEPEHNHSLAPKGTKQMLLSKRVSFIDGSTVHSRSSRKSVDREIDEGTYSGYIDKGQRNYLRTKRQRDMKLGEAGDLLAYFEKRRLGDPSFFFAIQLDVEDLITNVFWADTKMILDYKLFGDVMSFEMPHKNNIYPRPFALFVGSNHFGKMLTFGAALVYDETMESYKWLFEAFLKAMSDRSPKTVLTSQDEAISEAISSAMPESFHGFCAWHMEPNALKHLNHVFKGSDSFGKEFFKFIHDFEEEEEFLNAWDAMLDKYDLRDNEWLKGIFPSREKWAMVYGRETFSAGMRTTRLSESFVSALSNHLKSDPDELQFFEHFERAVDAERKKELEASYEMTLQIPTLKVDVPMLRYARDIYTPPIFEMFQQEWERSLLVVVTRCTNDGPCQVYRVSTVGNSQEHTVITKPSDATVCCSCRKFEYLGILCSHALKILDMMNVKIMIPSHYILKRWTKDARAGCFDLIDGGEGTGDDLALSVKNRYKILGPTFVQIAARASESKAGYELAAKYANQLVADLEVILKAENSSAVLSGPSTTLEGLDVANNRSDSMKSKGSKNDLTRRVPKDGFGKGRTKKMAQSAQLHSNNVVQSGPTFASHVNPFTPISQPYQMPEGLDDVNSMPWYNFQQAQVMHQVATRGSFMEHLRDSICLDLFEDSRGPNATHHNH